MARRAASAGSSFNASAPATLCATSLCSARIPAISRSNASAHSCAWSLTRIKSVVIRTRPPSRCALPSRMSSTPSSRPIWSTDLSLFLYRITEVRAITLSVAGCSRPSWVISSWVRPSARYSCSGSPLRLASGSTASRIEGAGAGNGHQPVRQATMPRIASGTTSTASAAIRPGHVCHHRRCLTRPSAASAAALSSGPRHPASARAISSADSYRSAGSFARHRSTIVCNSCGTSFNDGGASFRME